MRRFKMHMNSVADHLSVEFVQIQSRAENFRIAVMEGAHAVATMCNAGSSGSDGVLDLIKAGAAVTAGNAGYDARRPFLQTHNPHQTQRRQVTVMICPPAKS